MESMENFVDAFQHYKGIEPKIEHDNLPECNIEIKNIGWTLGNDCPYKCKHCYSMSARLKGMNFSTEIVDRIVSELIKNGVETVNLGGNEPLFTNGINPKNSLMPYIIESLTVANIKVGLTTSGVSLIYLEKHHRKAFELLNDVDVSFDSPFKEEHNQNRGATIYGKAIKALEICKNYNKPHSIIMCGMNWNFTEDRIRALVELAKKYGSNLRINPIKPVEGIHMLSALSASQYYEGFSLLLELCESVDLGEPPIASLTKYSNAKGCPCGRTSFRIHSITPDGKIPVSPCVYLHDYKVGDLVKDDLYDIIRSPQFKIFRMRNANPELIEGCKGCHLVNSCRGGCAARSYLNHLHSKFSKSLFVRDPYCPKKYENQYDFPKISELKDDLRLVHMDYLCTWIGRPHN